MNKKRKFITRAYKNGCQSVENRIGNVVNMYTYLYSLLQSKYTRDFTRPPWGMDETVKRVNWDFMLALLKYY